MIEVTLRDGTVHKDDLTAWIMFLIYLPVIAIYMMIVLIYLVVGLLQTAVYKLTE